MNTVGLIGLIPFFRASIQSSQFYSDLNGVKVHDLIQIKLSRMYCLL